MFFQQDLKVFLNDRDYARYEAQLLKLIFSSYTEAKMKEHGFPATKLNDDWELINSVRKRNGRTIAKTGDFLKLRVVREIWMRPTHGFFQSEEMHEFVRKNLADQREEYIRHFEKFCSSEYLNFN